MLNAVVAELSIHKLKKRTHRFSVTLSFAPKRLTDTIYIYIYKLVFAYIYTYMIIFFEHERAIRMPRTA